MRTDDFTYDLPPELIAAEPLADRAASRLLIVGDQSLHDSFVKELPAQLKAGDLLVLNNTKVIPARLFGQKASGGKIEVLVERILSDTQALVHLKASKSPKAGARLIFENNVEAKVKGRDDALFHLEFDAPLLEILDRIGHMPLPPYIDRADTLADRERYQTVFAQQPGAVAAPTAGLHFTESLLEELKQKGVDNAQVTLHVGAGTFQPVRVDDVTQHKMHAEWVQVPQATVDKIKATKAAGGRVVAIGTTAVRALESAALNEGSSPEGLQAFEGDTRIFIYPGFEFKVVDILLTNFHLPKSTLLMLVSAFAGQQRIFSAYQHAIETGYRFFSYGDAMLLQRSSKESK